MNYKNEHTMTGACRRPGVDTRADQQNFCVSCWGPRGTTLSSLPELWWVYDRLWPMQLGQK